MKYVIHLNGKFFCSAGFVVGSASKATLYESIQEANHARGQLKDCWIAGADILVVETAVRPVT